MICIEKDEIEVKCNKCGINRFIVKKPKIEIQKDHLYYSCSKCVVKERKKKPWRVVYSEQDKIDKERSNFI